jgi:hypothetical protein
MHENHLIAMVDVLEGMVNKGETVDLVMVAVLTREVTTLVEAVMGAVKVAMILMAVVVTVGVEVVKPRAKFGRPFLVRVKCDVF